MASQDRLIKLACTACKRVTHWSSKNKKLVTRKIELKKYCKWCKGQEPHKETKK
ncbi:MAG: 50S ribosomal protein L33 [Candidatus Pacebacteria bacterium]|nr:50S ribosomal protein L33 [Candidatus Paceibacterota bacterium]